LIDLLLQTCINAIYAASFMALIAVGLVLIFGVMGIINFAHGELYMLGAYVVVFLYADNRLPFFLAVALGLIFVGLVAWNGPCSGPCAIIPWADSSSRSASF
jgi:branched-chain amino acid transport system permease protein